MDNQSIFPNASLSTPKEPTLISAHTKIILFAIILVWTLVGNILVIVVIFCNQGLRTNFNYLIVNMAISDLAVPLFSLPLKIAEEASGMRYRWFVGGALGNVLCKVCYLLTDISPAVSVFTLLVISVNRLLAIIYPVQAQQFSKKKGCLLISVTWILAIAVFSPYLYVYKITTHNNLHFCYPMWPTVNGQTIFITTLTMILFLIPMILITLVYSFLIYKVSRGSQMVNNMLNNQQAQSRRKRNRQIFYISVAVVASFIILWGPFYSFLSVVSFIWKWKIPLDQKALANILFIVMFVAYLNPAINPCIYFLFLKNYRQGLKKILQRRKIRRCSETQTFYMRTLRTNALTGSGSNIEDQQCKLMTVKAVKL